jgi:hypothetical protein
MDVYVAAVLHQYGVTFFVNHTEAGRNWLSEELEGEPPADDDDAVEQYFEQVLSDTVWLGNGPEMVRP